MNSLRYCGLESLSLNENVESLYPPEFELPVELYEALPRK